MGFKYGDIVYICSPHAISLNRGNNLSDGAWKELHGRSEPTILVSVNQVKVRMFCFVIVA